VRVHILQYDIIWEDKPLNHAIVRSMLERAKPEPHDLVVLPEMFDTGFSLRVHETNDDNALTANFLRSIAAEYSITVQGAQTIRLENAKGLNRAIVFDPSGKQLAAYDKVHPFTFSREGEAFIGGTEITAYTWGEGNNALRICPAICYDLRFPELFRAGLARGAEAFAIGANWPSARTAHWRALVIARAIENQSFVFAANRCGQDPHLAYEGNSMVVAPDGAILAELAAEPGVLSVEISPKALRSWRNKFPAWRDRRPGVYAGWGWGLSDPGFVSG
jgi:predicted amidohydrolase